MTDLTRANESWLTSPIHQQWLRDQGQALVDFAKAARVPCGFAALDPFGRRPNNAPADTITTARMVHSFSLAHIQGLPGCAPLIDHGSCQGLALGVLDLALHEQLNARIDAVIETRLAFGQRRTGHVQRAFDGAWRTAGFAGLFVRSVHQQVQVMLQAQAGSQQTRLLIFTQFIEVIDRLQNSSGVTSRSSMMFTVSRRIR